MPHHQVRNDFNGDGKSDILWRNDTGLLTDWLGTVDGSFTDNSANALNGAADTNWITLGSGDFNGDGRTDILWRNLNTGAITDWLGNANGSFTDNAAHALNGSAATSWQINGVGDFNGDGRSDIIFRDIETGYLTEWLGTASGGFIDNAAVAGNGNADTSWHLLGVNDVNGDGIDDLVWQNTGGYVTDWLGTSTGAFTDNSVNAGTAAVPYTIVGTGDFNGDGRADILLWFWTDQYMTEWFGTANGGFTDSGAVTGTAAFDNNWDPVSIGDFNGDGRSDILWRDFTNGYLTEWLGTSTGAFTDNSAAAATGAADNHWHVQDRFF